MRVTVVSRIYRPEPSAASFFLGGVVDALVDAGHQVEVITARPPKGLATGSTRERVKTFSVLRDKQGYIRGYVQYMSFDLPLFARLLFARRPDVVFVEPPPTTGAVIRLVCAIRRIPYVYDAADIWSDAAGHATSSGLVVRVLRGIETFAMRGAARSVTISEPVAARMRELGVMAPIEITGFGADTTSFHYSHAEIKPVFLYAGSYSAWHGAGILIDAFADFSRTHPGFTLQFIGNSTEQAALEARTSELGLADSVKFHKAVSASDLRPLLVTSTASVATLLPGSGYDYAFTTKAYSALASGSPVIFAGPGPTASFINEANQHVRAGSAVEYNVAEIASAMRELTDNPASDESRARTAEWTAENHSMAATSRRVRDAILATARRE